MLELMQYPFMKWRNPFLQMEGLARQMDWLTSGMLGGPELPLSSAKVFPAVNITEDTEKYYVRAELPGIKADELHLEVMGRNLSISGERKIQSEGEDAKYRRREREAGTFSRVISLPGDLNADSVGAEMVNGILTIAISKSEAAKPKQIPVHS